MKRSPLRRRTPLQRVPFGFKGIDVVNDAPGDGTPSPGGLPRRSRLKPISDKRAARLESERGQVEREGKAFRDAIKGKVCVVCGRSEREAYALSGFGHQAHHGLSQQLLRRLGLQELLWAPQLAVCVCVSCHAAHTSRRVRIARERLPEPLRGFCREHGLERWLELEYPH